jgi:hypothetical protein
VDVGVPKDGHDGQAVDSRQHAIEGDRVEPLAGGADQAFSPIGHPLDMKAVRGQLRHDLACGRLVVFDGKDVGHAPGLPRQAPGRGVAGPQIGAKLVSSKAAL